MIHMILAYLLLQDTNFGLYTRTAKLYVGRRVRGTQVRQKKESNSLSANQRPLFLLAKEAAFVSIPLACLRILFSSFCFSFLLFRCRTKGQYSIHVISRDSGCTPCPGTIYKSKAKIEVNKSVKEYRASESE